MKNKACHTCKEEETTMYRIQTQKGKIWIFVCEACCKIHQKGEFYRYGGTWKGYRH